MATELATAYLSLIPELKGAGKSIAAQLDGVDVAPSGRKIGKSLSDGISSGIDSSGIKQLENAVANASQKVGRAMASEKDATNQLKIAQQRLIEVRSKYADGSSQVMAAEAKVESAQRKATSASERTKSAQVELKRAQEQLSAANKKVSSSSDDASRGIASMGKTAGSIKGALSTLAKVAGPALAAIGFSQLVGEAAAATDATQKFKSTLDFAGLGTSEIDALSKSTRKYADETVYALSDIQNITAQLAANSVPNYDKLAEAAGNLNAVAGGNAETFSSVGMVLTQTAGAGKLTTENWNQLADAIPGASGKLQEAMRANGAYTGDFRDAMAKGEISAEEFNQAIMDLGFEDAAVKAAKSTSTFEGAFGNLQAAAVGGISDILTKLQPAITGAINGITPIVEGAFTALSAGVGIFIDKLAEVGTALQPFVEQAQAQLAPALSEIGTAFQALWTAIQPVVQMVISTVVPLVGQVITLLASLAATIMSAVAPVITNIAALITTLMPTIQMIWTTAMTAIMGVVNAVWPFIQTLITTVMSVINAVITTVLAIINGGWAGAWEGIKAVASSIWEGIKSVITTVMGVIQSVINIALAVINGDWEGAWNTVSSFLSGAWDGIRNAVSTGIDNVVNFFANLPGNILGALGDLGSLLWDAGSSIIDGLWSGLKSAWNNVSSWFGDITSMIPQLKGPLPVDAKLLVTNGEAIMGGLLTGLGEGWGDVESYLSSRTGRIPSALAADGVAGARGAVLGRGGGVSNNIYIDGAKLDASPQIEQAISMLVGALAQQYDMGIA